MNTKKFFVGAALVFALLFAGCSFSSSLSPEDRPEKETIQLGGIFALSGVGASVGQQEHQAARLAVEQINQQGGIEGKQIDFSVEDISLDKMKQIPAAVSKLLDIDQVQAIVGPTWDEPAAQMLPLMEEANIPIIMPNSSDDLEKGENFDYAFATWHDNVVGIEEILRYAKKK